MSVVPKRRWLEKFTDAGGSNPYVFPRLEHEWTPSQAMDVPLMPVVGASYGLNLLGNGMTPKRFGSERVRFLVMHSGGNTVDAQIDDLNRLARRNALGKLWMLDDAGSRRWAKAQAVSMPDWNFGPKNREFVPVSIEFVRLSDWYAETETVITQAVIASPTSFSAANTGTADVYNSTVEFRANAAGGFGALTLENLSTGDRLLSSRSAQSSQSILKVDCGRSTVQYSNDGGASWINDYSIFSWGTTQMSFLRLVFGINNLRYSQSTGVPNLTIVIRFYAAFD